MLDLKNLETFYWVARLGGFRLAAQRLHTTQSAVSQRIEALEKVLGTRLLDRLPRRALPTATGRALLPYAEQMLQLRTEMVRAVGEPRSIQGKVRLGVSETIVYTNLIALVNRVNEVYPSVALDIEVDISTQLQNDLLSGGLDMVILFGSMIEPNVHSLPYARYPMAWVASPKLKLPRGRLGLRQLANYPVMTYSRATKPFVNLRDLFQRANIKDPRLHGNSSLSAVMKLCTEGLAISAIPPVIVRRELGDGTLVQLDVVDAPLADLEFTLSYVRGSDTFLLDAIAELALEVAARDSGPPART